MLNCSCYKNVNTLPKTDNFAAIAHNYGVHEVADNVAAVADTADVAYLAIAMLLLRFML